MIDIILSVPVNYMGILLTNKQVKLLAYPCLPHLHLSTPHKKGVVKIAEIDKSHCYSLDLSKDVFSRFAVPEMLLSYIRMIEHIRKFSSDFDPVLCKFILKTVEEYFILGITTAQGTIHLLINLSTLYFVGVVKREGWWYFKDSGCTIEGGILASEYIDTSYRGEIVMLGLFQLISDVNLLIESGANGWRSAFHRLAHNTSEVARYEFYLVFFLSARSVNDSPRVSDKYQRLPQVWSKTSQRILRYPTTHEWVVSPSDPFQSYDEAMQAIAVLYGGDSDSDY